MYCNTTSEVQKVVAALLFTNESHITSNLCKCNVAHKTTVIFAIAFATALCLGKQPGQLCFDENRMCTHLLKCIESQEMTMFPVRSEERERDELVSNHIQFSAPAG